MATALSNITQNRAQALVGNIDATLPGQFTVFAVERGKRAIVDAPFALIAATVLWTSVVNDAAWSIWHLPFVWVAVLLPYAFYDGGLM